MTRAELAHLAGGGNDDPDYQRTVQMSRDYGLSEHVTFVGRVDQGDLPVFCSAADMLVVPSSYESFGMVALESLACGTPVVATPVGAMDAVLRDPSAGRVAPDLRPESLAAAIEGMRIGRESHPAALETIRRSVLCYNWSRVAADVLNVYRRCVESSMASAARSSHSGHHGRRHPKVACCGCGLFAMVEDGG